MSRLLVGITIVCLIKGLGTDGLTDYFFTDISPNLVRGIKGESVEIPFAISNTIINRVWKTVITKNDGNELYRSTGEEMMETNSDRFKVSYGIHSEAINLVINEVSKSDEGIYSCEVTPNSGKPSKKYVELRVLESSEGLRWDSTYRCGADNILDGVPAECDPYGAHPCCSNANWCGFTRFHCDCYGCLDYRLLYKEKLPSASCPLSYYFIRGRCLKALPQPVGWREALASCSKAGAKLALFDAADGIVEELHKFLGDPNAAEGPDGLFWVGVKADEVGSGEGHLFQWIGNGTNTKLDQEFTFMEESFTGSSMICDDSNELQLSQCDENSRRPICEIAAAN